MVLKAALILLYASLGLSAQSLLEAQFISAQNNQIRGIIGTLGSPTRPVTFGANLVLANGATIGATPLDALLAYVDGLKQAGAQRVEFNPGVMSLSDASVMAKYDAIVEHIRRLGLRLAINPEVIAGELGARPTFQSFQTAALAAYQQLAARYQPDNFVIVHDASTMDGRLGLLTNLQAWHGFILAAAPLIKAASPRTRVGAGGYLNGAVPFLSLQENSYWLDFVTIASLDFMTMDIYNTDATTQYIYWSNLAHSNNKGVYIEETWAPQFLPSPIPNSALNPFGYLTTSLDTLAIAGPCNSDFVQMDATWIQAMTMFASFYGMESVTFATTETFFAVGTNGHDRPSDATYTAAVIQALGQGSLTATAKTYQGWAAQYSVKTAASLSSASYATLTGAYGVNPDSLVAADELVSAFGADLAGATVTLVDSSNTSFPVTVSSGSPLQVNYLVPSKVKTGPASITIQAGDGVITTGIVLVASAAPGLYTTTSDGKGAAAAILVVAHRDGTQSVQTSQPFSLGAEGDAAVVELFGTGIRHGGTVTAQVAGQTAQVLFAGDQGGYAGLDQVNVALPHSLAGSGTVNVALTVDGAAANPVTLAIQ